MVAFLQELLSDEKRFPGFPKDTHGMIIVDTHPYYAPPRTDEVIGDNKFRVILRNFASELQCGPIFNKEEKHLASTLKKCCNHSD
jgi:hypothetical protein